MSLYLDPKIVSKNNKKIPLETMTQEPHRCKYRSNYSIPCRTCGVPFTFSDSVFSLTSGKKIPLNAVDGQPHDCLRKLMGMR